MRGVFVGWTVALACTITGCGQEVQQPTMYRHENSSVVNKESGVGASQQSRPDAKKPKLPHVQAPLGVGNTESWSQVPFRITKVFEKRTLTTTPPYRGDGGKWTFFDCQTANGDSVMFTIGVCPRGEGEGPFAWGRAVLAVADRTAGDRFLMLFAKAFHTTLPKPRPPSTHLDPLVVDTAILGEDLKRNPGGGFAGTGEGWTATKWFPQKDGLEAEIFFNYNLQSRIGEFREKDPDYREPLLMILAMALRDGPRPERTPKTDPNLRSGGPQIEEVCCLARYRSGHYSFSPGGKHAIYQDKSVVYAVDPFRPDAAVELARFEHRLWGIHVLDQELRLLASEALSKSDTGMSSDDPKQFWWVEPGGKGKQLLFGPGKDIDLGDSPVSPDQRYVVIERWKDRTEGQGRYAVVSFFDRRTRQTKLVELSNQSLSAVGWRQTNGELRAVLATNCWRLDPNEKQHAYLADPATGKLVLEPGVAIPDSQNRPISPDGKHRAEIEGKDRLVVVNLATNQKQAFSFHEDDLPFVGEGCVEWAGPRHLQFDARRLALIDITTMKMNYPTTLNGLGTSSSYLFSPDFRWVLCQKEDAEKSGLYLGRVVLPEQRYRP